MRIAIAVIVIVGVLMQGAWVRAAESAGVGADRVVVDERTEAVIRGALKWLASRQNGGNGSWAADGPRFEVAMTGYVLMAFLAAGHLPDEGEYGRNVTAGMNFLLNATTPTGLISSGDSGGNGTMYSHGIATIALGELYGQTRDPRIRGKLESAIRLIVNAQNQEGGWRYQPRAADADMSVTVLQVVALRAAKNAGLDVPQTTIDRAIKYVLSCRHDRSGGFTYQPNNNAPGFARTAAAIYSLQVCGQYDDPNVLRGRDYILQQWQNTNEWFTYGHFYAAPAMYMIGGPTWENWYRKVRAILLERMKQQGDMVYWEPWDSRREGGTVYATAVYATILAMPYHYVPLYQR